MFQIVSEVFELSTVTKRIDSFVWQVIVKVWDINDLWWYCVKCKNVFKFLTLNEWHILKELWNFSFTLETVMHKNSFISLWTMVASWYNTFGEDDNESMSN